jgi:hypothetical protein
MKERLEGPEDGGRQERRVEGREEGRDSEGIQGRDGGERRKARLAQVELRVNAVGRVTEKAGRHSNFNSRQGWRYGAGL